MLNIIITRLEGRRRSGLVSAVSQVDWNRRTGVCFYWTVQPYPVHWPASVNADVSTSGVNREAYLKRGHVGAFNSGTHNALSEQCAYLYGKAKSKP